MQFFSYTIPEVFEGINYTFGTAESNGKKLASNFLIFFWGKKGAGGIDDHRGRDVVEGKGTAALTAYLGVM